VSKDKPDSFRDLEGQFPDGVPGYLTELVAVQYALEIHNGIAGSWKARLDALLASGEIAATDLDALEATILFLAFQNELEKFKDLSIRKVRQANTQAKAVERHFYLLRDAMDLIPNLKISWSETDLDSN